MLERSSGISAQAIPLKVIIKLIRAHCSLPSLRTVSFRFVPSWNWRQEIRIWCQGCWL